MRIINSIGLFIPVKLSLILAISICSISAQDVKQATLEWTKVSSSSGDLSVAIPSDSWVTDNEDGVRRIYRSVEGTNVNITFEPRSGAKTEFQLLLKRPLGKDDKSKKERYEMGDFLVEQTDGPKREYPYSYFYMASSKGRYTISVSAHGEDSEFYRLVLGSIELGGIPLYDKLPRPSINRKISSTQLSADEQVTSALKVSDSTQEVFLRSDEKAEELGSGAGSVQNITRALIILRKAKASYTKGTRSKGIRGIVTFKVSFRADGSLGEIVLLESLDKELDRSAFEAARKIKFLPQIVDGQSVETSRRVSYSFNIY